MLARVDGAEQDFLPGLITGGTADFGQCAAVIAFGQEILINYTDCRLRRTMFL